MNLKSILEGVSSTGFELEYKVSEILRENGWTVINNKYFVDDTQRKVREIDIIGYKVSNVLGTFVYTVLLISCKKSEKDVWCLLSKEKDTKNPNYDWKPLNLWTNNINLKYMFETSKWKELYFDNCPNSLVTDIYESNDHVFSFQEMNKTSGKPQNDKNIYSSIESLMKSMGYYMKNLETRKKDKCLYDFNLISLIDSELVKVRFDGDKKEIVSIDDEKYISHYIVNNEDVCSRIHFLRFDDFKKRIKKYNEVHTYNKKYTKTTEEVFYEDFFKNSDKKSLYSEIFDKKLNDYLKSRLYYDYDYEKKFNIYYYSTNKEGVIEFSCNTDDVRVVEFLNRSEQIRYFTKNLLNECFNYKDDFLFIQDDIPF